MRHLILIAAAGFAPAFAPVARAQTVDSGLTLFQTGDRATAWSVLRPFGRDTARAAYVLGRIALDQGHFGDAVDWFERAVALDTGNATYWDKLGQAYAGHALESDFFTKYKMARRCKSAFEHAVALDSTNLDARTDVIEYYAQAPGIVGGDKRRAREMAAALALFAPFSGVQTMLLICRVSHDAPCVHATADTLIAQFPDSSLGYVALSQFYADSQQFDSAFAVLDRRLSARPDDWQSLYQLGRVGATSGRRLDEAAVALTRYIGSPVGTNPSKRVQLSGAHLRLGTVYERANQPDSARAEFKLALTINPKDGDAKKALRSLR